MPGCGIWPLARGYGGLRRSGSSWMGEPSEAAAVPCPGGAEGWAAQGKEAGRGTDLQDGVCTPRQAPAI